MRKQHEAAREMRRIGWILGLTALSALVAFLVWSPVGAQETPEPTAEDAADAIEAPPQGGPLLRIEIDVSEEPVPQDEEFDVTVLVEDVEHLAAFEFRIEYDRKRVQPVKEEAASDATPVEGLIEGGGAAVKVTDIGAFLESSERGDGLVCLNPATETDPDTGNGLVVVSCSTLGPPICLEGSPGAEGSGVLGRVMFEGKGGGDADFQLLSTNLVGDDLEPCDPTDGQAQSITHRVEGASVEIASSGNVSWGLVLIIIAVVVVVIVGGGVGGFAWSRRGGSEAAE